MRELIKALKSHSVTEKRNAVLALANLAANAENQERIAQAAGIAPLVSLLSDSDTQVRLVTAWALWNLADNHPSNKERIALTGGIVPLVTLLSDPDWQVRREAAGALANLAVHAANQERIVKASGIAPLVILLRDSNAEVRLVAALALGNLAANTTNKELIAQAEGIAPLVTLLVDSDTQMRLVAAWVLASLGVNTENQERIAQADGIVPLVSLLSDSCIHVQIYAAWALIHLALNTENQEHIAQAAGIIPLVSLLSDPDTKMRENAASVLMHLAFNTENKKRIVEAGAIAPLVSLLSDPNTKVQYYAVWALSNLATNIENKEIIAKEGGIDPIVALLSNPDGQVQYCAVCALCDLALNTENQELIAQAGAIVPLVALFNATQENVAGALCNLALNPANKDIIAQAGAIAAIIPLMYSEKDTPLRRNALGACWNLAKDHPGNQGRIFQATPLSGQIKYLYGSDNHMRDYTLGGLHLPKHVFSGLYISLGPLISALSSLKSSYSINSDVKYRADQILKSIVDNHPGDHQRIAHASGIAPSVEPLTDPTTHVRKSADLALYHLNALPTPKVADPQGGGGAKAPDVPPIPQLNPPAFPGAIVLEDELTFEIRNCDRLGGSAFIIGVFINKKDKSLWVGKCNVLSSELAAEADACKEIIASDIYAYFGVNVPKTMMARLPIQLPNWAEGDVRELGCEVDRTHTVYMLSEIIAGFHLFGAIPAFDNPERFLLNIPNQGHLEVQGLGHVLAVALFMNDYDVIGGSGGNIGVQVVDGVARCIKIDPGEAFNTLKALQVGPRKLRVATQALNGVLNFEKLPKKVRSEFLETLALIVATTDAQLKQLIRRPGAQSVSDGEMGSVMLRIMISNRDGFRDIYSEDLEGVIGIRPQIGVQALPINDQDIATALLTLRDNRETRRPVSNLGSGGAEAPDVHDALEDLKIPYKDIAYNPEDPSTRLGSGTFAEVFKATWQNIEVAFKRLKVQALNEKTIEELRHEGAVMKGLRHPNIVTFYGICAEPGHFGLIIKFAKNGSLYNVLYDDPSTELNWGRRIKIALGIAMGLNYLHTRPRQPILHLDLKSSNVLMQGDAPKLADFGLSKVKDIAITTLKQGIGQGGTLPWMAQELLADEDAPYTTLCDVFSFAMILSEIANRRLPWEGLGMRMIGQVIQGKRPSLPQEGLPHGFATLTGRCWAVDPTTRPKMQSVVEDLETMKQQLGV